MFFCGQCPAALADFRAFTSAEAGVVCACALGLLYEMSAEEAYGRVRSYASLRAASEDTAVADADAAAADAAAAAELQQVRRFIRKARASDCAEE